MKDLEFRKRAVENQRRYILKKRAEGIVITTKENAKKYADKFYNKHPWATHFKCAKSRCCYKAGNYFGRVKFDITLEEVKELWIRDKAHLLKRPSIDRIDSKKGYSKSNCRFIELLDNLRLGARKLEDTEVVKIKELYATSGLSQYKLAKMFNVDQSLICLIVNNKRWAEKRYEPRKVG